MSELAFEIKPSFSNISFLWTCSQNSVAIMNIGNLEDYTTIENFWEDEPKNLPSVEPISLVMNIKPEKVLGLAKVKGAFVLRTHELEKKKTRSFVFNDYQMELGLPGSQFEVITIDKSQRTNLFFAAFLVPKVSPFIIQIKIAKEGLSAVCSLLFEIDGFSEIQRTSSYPIGKTDYLLVSGTNTVVVLKGKDKSLTILHKFSNILAGDVSDTCIFKNKFFSVSPNIPFIIEATANNKVDSKDVQRHFNMEEKKKTEIKFDRYDITKLELSPGKFHKLDISKKGDALYAIGKGITSITDINTAKPQKSDVLLDSKQISSR